MVSIRDVYLTSAFRNSSEEIASGLGIPAIVVLVFKEGDVGGIQRSTEDPLDVVAGWDHFTVFEQKTGDNTFSVVWSYEKQV